ncbi:MAG: hypothetical protein A2381_19290 [Bdellovibrionales bacterium RIFOXYB1_FULL_37_110]|nr:MAG: hypothetical protein A2181_00135 [Bdellovibrionales bacterium RIFOXYA1_FULL_38_20]OFZ49523.1 MAG: hypothetical protein A2417_04440 [Bdellovibrionales bacterium RIFOXYC1_FULL_37_79]OFZ58677.1 MAG: hypothetical protein A2381_19290 [Bdellovibrionales bacterium RIFOXYB1_FULL_37_110]OFZ63205.1 MAG: hypothetical protein A2577_16795 [Bdellovibrionales bacterium RIFOXYD1_FULL_36_51]
MKMIVIILVIWLGTWACSSNPRVEVETDPADLGFLMKNPCWGASNLEKLFIKWNWIKLEDAKRYIREPVYLDFKIVRFNQLNEEQFGINLYQSRKTSIPTTKQYNLFSTYYTYELYIKDIKQVLINDTEFFKDFEFDQFNAKEWEEKEELGEMYESASSRYRESFLISSQRKGCNSSFFAKTPHVLKITLLDQKQLAIITAYVPLKQIKRAPPYFSPSELIKFGSTFQGELYAASMNLSLVLEQF